MAAFDSAGLAAVLVAAVLIAVDLAAVLAGALAAVLVAVVFFAAADLAADFPQGVTSTAWIAVAQWGEGFGWGSEAEVEAEIRRV